MKVREHFCDEVLGWVPGSVSACGRHEIRGSAGSVTPLKDRFRKIVEGVSKSGMVSAQGLMTTVEGWDGEVSQVAQPRGIHYEWSVSKKRLRRIDPKQIPYNPKEHRVRVVTGKV